MENSLERRWGGGYVKWAHYCDTYHIRVQQGGQFWTMGGYNIEETFYAHNSNNNDAL